MSVLRVGNCSGFYGDRFSAMREMVTGGDLDVLTGDYLAELTMAILGKDTLRDPGLGYARTFPRQLEQCLGEVLERGVRIVVNAGGLNPAGLAAKVREVAAGLGLDPAVAHVEGDDLRPQFPGALTANAYLGGFGIAAALHQGADVVVTGRVADASLVCGAAAYRHDWTPDDLDALAGAVVAGHVLECGTQATGGNFSGFAALVEAGLMDRPLGFPLAEIAADGSSVITKHPGTGGAVTVDTVTAQLLYEIDSPRYLGPDVTARLDTVRLTQEGPDRVAITGVRGEEPPQTLKVCVNELGGWRNRAEVILTGLDRQAKEDWLRAQCEAAWSPRPATVVWDRTDAEDHTLLRCTVLDDDAQVAGKGFTAPLVELALGSFPGFTLTAPPAPATPYAVCRSATTPRVEQRVVGPDADAVTVVPAARGRRATPSTDPQPHPTERAVDEGRQTHTVTRPLGTVVHARSGDKGGDANLGLWTEPARAGWLLDLVTDAWVREVLPEARDLDLEIWPLPNLHGVNVVLHGLLGDGVAASTRRDPQAKVLGEQVRAVLVEIPEEPA